jgi:acetolactate synthase-1/2/3 large subunit
MAAEAYSRITGKLGVGIVTSGPGATNLTTGIAGAFFDSVPCLLITGQVSTFRKSKGLGVRQYGFQETPITEILKPISKATFEVDNADDIVHLMRYSISAALDGRPGPVVIDIPDNIQREYLDVEKLKLNTNVRVDVKSDLCELSPQEISAMIRNSKRPVILCGWGTVLSGCEEIFLGLLDQWKLPVALTWGAKHLVPYDREYLLGTFGTHGNRTANKAIQESDLLICFGTRLDTKATGSPPNSFAPNAKKVMVDIDNNEFAKFSSKGLNIDAFYCCDFRTTNSKQVIELLRKIDTLDSHKLAWKKRISHELFSQEVYPTVSNYVNPYDFMSKFSEVAPSNCRVLVDTGCAVAWTMQAWNVKIGQRIFHDFNNTAMGWSIPATLASIAINDLNPTICIVGDGSLMMSLGDLATIYAQPSPVMILLLNNGGYSMIKQTQEQWFDSNYFASDVDSGMAFPNFELTAKSFGYEFLRISTSSFQFSADFIERLTKKKIFVEVMIDPGARVVPQNRFGNPIHVMEP